MEYLTYLWQLINGFRLRHERWLADIRAQDLHPHMPDQGRLRILDLANGRLRPQYTLLKAKGHLVCGVDLANEPDSSWMNRLYGLARWMYTRRLSTGRNADIVSGLVCSDAAVLPFRDEYFDVATSVAAFEHFLEPPRVLSEVQRVLRSGGLLWTSIHIFTSLSGAHNITQTQIPLRRVPKGVEPWDHLRKRRLPFHVPLNEWRIQQYLDAFAQHFEIVKHYCALREGEHLLSPQIELELCAYSREELTCGSYVIVAKKN